MFYKISIALIVSLFCASLYASQIITPPEGYSFKAELKETSILLGETTQLTLIYKYKDVEDYEIIEPQFRNIILKELNSKDYKDSQNSFVEEITYSLKALQEGNFSLKNIQVDTQIIDVNYKNFDNRSKYTKKFKLIAKSINLEVKKLPQSISAIGNYRLQTTVDKSRVHKGDIVTLTLSLYGDGNIQNLDAIEPHIKDATSYLIYTTTSKRQHLQTKVYEIISEKSFIIPSFELLYFDKKVHAKRSTKSKKYQITIIDSKVKKNIYKDIKSSSIQKGLYFILGVLASIIILIFYKLFMKFKSIKKESKLIKELKKIKTKNALYKKTVPYLKKDRELDVLIYKLESGDYKSFKGIKKRIILLFNDWHYNNFSIKIIS